MRVFWKIIEYIYVHTEYRKFSAEDVKAYKKGKLTVDHKELVNFFWYGFMLGNVVIIVAVLQIATALMFEWYYAGVITAIEYDIVMAIVVVKSIIKEFKEFKDKRRKINE